MPILFKSDFNSLIRRILAKRCWALVLLSLLFCRTFQNFPAWNDHRAIHHASFHSVLLRIAPVLRLETKSLILACVPKDLPWRKMVKKLFDHEIAVSTSPANTLIKDANREAAGILNSEKSGKPRTLLKTPTACLIIRVKKVVVVRTPSSKKAFGRKMKASQSSVH